MTSNRTEMLRTQAKALLPDIEKARDIIEKAEREGRPMNIAEKAAVDPILAKSKTIADALRQDRADAAVMAAARALADEIGGPAGSPTTAGIKSGQRLSFKGMASEAASRMIGTAGAQKALAVSGTAVVPQSFVADPIALGRPATGLLDVIPVRQQTSPSFAYLRQITRDNNAAIVAEGALKPVTDIGLERVEATLDVVAHLSQACPKFWFEDVVQLERFVANELSWGLGIAIEQKLLTDISDTSGIQEQTFSTSALETIRRSITLLETAGHQASAVALHPADWADLELALASTNAVERMGLPFDAATRRIFGVVIASTTSQPVGTATVLASDAVILETDREGVRVDWSENAGAETFARNEIVCRVETRVQTSVQSPLGVVVATIAD